VSEVGLSQAARGTCTPAEVPPAPRDDEPRLSRKVVLRCGCAPRPVSVQFKLLSGVNRNVSADGTVEMTETDAAPLLSAGWVRAWKQDLSK
jgi:hypothetical protein